MTLPPDERDALAELAAAGDREAASAAIEAVRPLVAWKVGRMAVPPRDRDEVIDDALAEVALKLPGYDRRRANFSTFVVEVVYWHVRNRRRQRGRGPRTVALASPGHNQHDVGAAEPADDAALDPGDLACDRIDAAALWGRLDELPAVQREAVAGWARGWTDESLAAERGVTASAVQQARTRGLDFLKRSAGA